MVCGHHDRLWRLQFASRPAFSASLLRRCGNLKALPDCRRAHDHVVRCGQQRNQLLGNLLVAMYGKCAALVDARSVFEKMCVRNVFSWTIIIAAHAQLGQNQEALEFYGEMLKERVNPDKVTFLGVLGACSNVGDLPQGKEIHALIVDAGLDTDVVVRTALVNMYGKCGSLDNARAVFEKLHGRDVVLWNSMMTAYTQLGHGEETFQLYEQMQREGLKPNKITFVSVLAACGIMAMIARGQEVHHLVIDHGYESHIIVGTALINMYSKCGRVKDAWKVFDNVFQRDVVLWNTMIAAFAQHGQDSDALNLYQQMLKHRVKPNQTTFGSILCAIISPAGLAQGKEIHASIAEHAFESNIIVETALVNMYGNCGRFEDARWVFSRMHARNVISWTAMIAACAQHGHAKEALQIHQQMLAEGVKPDKLTFKSILPACSCPAALADGKQIHARMVDSELDYDVELQTAVVTMYGKCGRVDDALKVFNKKDGISVGLWNAMMAVYTQHGHANEAMQLYGHMQDGMQPDKFSFSTVLGAISLLAALLEGKKIHKRIIKAGFQSDIAVGTALVNMYAKCGDLEDAWAVFDKMCGRNIITWNTMLAAYAQNGLGEEALQHFRQMQSEGIKADEITFTNIFHACSHTGLVDEALWYFGIMNEECKTLEHYACMIDLLGRAGQLDYVENLINQIPFQPDVVMLRSLLGACRVHGDVERGRHAADYIVRLDPQDEVPYVLLSNILIAEGEWDSLADIRKVIINTV